MKTISNKKEYNALIKRINELLEIVADLSAFNTRFGDIPWSDSDKICRYG